MEMMKMRKLVGLLIVFVLALLFVTTASAGTLLISQETPYSGYGYSLGAWSTFTGDINAAFGGAGNVTVNGADLNNLAYMMTFSALMVDARQPYGQVLSATEISNITAYEATGRRVLLIGENSNWSAWNTSILATVGGTFGGDSPYGVLNRVVNNSITAGSPTLNVSGDGFAVGGTALYSDNVLTQWGAGNVVSLLSVNVQQDGMSNDAFDNNLAIWLASGNAPAGTPEPGTLLLLASGMLGLGFSLRRKMVR
jgi:hypothetical protein